MKSARTEMSRVCAHHRPRDLVCGVCDDGVCRGVPAALTAEEGDGEDGQLTQHGGWGELG